MIRLFALTCLFLVACSSSDPDVTYLSNSQGKADAVELAISVSAASPSASLGVICDSPSGCDGAIEVTVRSPQACSILGDCTTIPMARVDVALATITQGSRQMELPIGVESTDGSTIQTSSVIEFTAAGDELVEISLQHVAGAPDVTLAIFAEWTSLSGGVDGGIDPDVGPLGDSGPSDGSFDDTSFDDASFDGATLVDVGIGVDAPFSPDASVDASIVDASGD